jgi:hypothetical protein
VSSNSPHLKEKGNSDELDVARAKYSTTYNNQQHFKANVFQIELLLTTDLLKRKK